MTRSNILIADDDRDFAESMAEALEIAGHAVELAFDGDEAVRKFRAGRFDLALLDVRMPKRSGVESLAEIRRLDPSARVVIVTGYSVPELLDEARHHGAWEILHKPLSMQTLFALVERASSEGVILLVEDDSDFAEELEGLLRDSGYRVALARDGEEAVRLLTTSPVKVLVLDLRLPDMDGAQVYRQLQNLGRAVPTIVVTAYADEEREQLGAMAVHEVLNKPFDPGRLLRALADLGAPRPRA